MAKLTTKLRMLYPNGGTALDAADLLEKCEKALTAAIGCPVIAERDIDPAWLCGQTEEAVRLIETTLAELRGDAQ